MENNNWFYIFLINPTDLSVKYEKATIINEHEEISYLPKDSCPHYRKCVDYTIPNDNKIYHGRILKCSTWKELIENSNKKILRFILSPFHYQFITDYLAYTPSTTISELENIKQCLTIGIKIIKLINQYGNEKYFTTYEHCIDEFHTPCNPKDFRGSWDVDVKTKYIEFAFTNVIQSIKLQHSNVEHIHIIETPIIHTNTKICFYGNTKLVKWKDGIVKGRKPVFYSINENIHIQNQNSWCFTDFNPQALQILYNALKEYCEYTNIDKNISKIYKKWSKK